MFTTRKDDLSYLPLEFASRVNKIKYLGSKESSFFTDLKADGGASSSNLILSSW